MPSPQRGSAQRLVQASSSTPLPSSHASPGACRMPSPQAGIVQPGLQVSPEAVLPSSQSSSASRMPLPHTAGVHSTQGGSGSSTSSVGALPPWPWLSPSSDGASTPGVVAMGGAEAGGEAEGLVGSALFTPIVPGGGLLVLG